MDPELKAIMNRLVEAMEAFQPSLSPEPYCADCRTVKWREAPSIGELPHELLHPWVAEIHGWLCRRTLKRLKTQVIDLEDGGLDWNAEDERARRAYHFVRLWGSLEDAVWTALALSHGELISRYEDIVEARVSLFVDIEIELLD